MVQLDALQAEVEGVTCKAGQQRADGDCGVASMVPQDRGCERADDVL